MEYFIQLNGKVSFTIFETKEKREKNRTGKKIHRANLVFFLLLLSFVHVMETNAYNSE